VRRLVWFRSLAAGAVGAVVLVAACEYLFDTTRPKIQFVTPGEADTVYSPVVFELNVQDGGFKALDLYVDGARVKTYSSSHVLDSLAMPAGGHVLSARAFDKGGNWAEERLAIAVVVLPIPVLDSPADGSVLAESVPRFRWSYAGTAGECELQVDNNGDFSSPAIDTTTADTSYGPGRALADGGYMWRVRAQGTAGHWSGWSSTWGFAVAVSGIAAPTLYEPGNGHTVGDATPDFDWSEPAGAVGYWLQVDDDQYFLSPEVDEQTLVSSQYTPVLPLADGRYHWRVKAQNAAQVWSGWSADFDFTLTSAGVPLLLEPADSAVVTTSQPKFTWSHVAGAAKYWLQVDSEPGFSVPLAVSESLSDTTYSPPTDLSDGGYFWRVRCRASTGIWGGWTEMRSFTVQLPVGDVGCNIILAPSGSLDSGQIVVPACSVYNYGGLTETYRVRIAIAGGYVDSATVTDHAAGTAKYVTFANWTAATRGALAVTCSTRLSGDGNIGNDSKIDTVTVEVRDVGVKLILAPSGTITAHTVVTPACSVFNHGSTAPTYSVRMRFETYDQTTTVTSHGQGTTQYVTFPDWTAVVGTHAVSCSTELATDLVKSNDKKTGSVVVNNIPPGTLKWRYQTGGMIYSSPAISTNGTIYVGSNDSYLYAVSEDGVLRWRHQTGGPVRSSPAVGPDGTIYVGSDDGCLYALNPDSTLKWRYQTGAGVESSPALAPDGTVYVGSGDGYLYAVSPDGTLKWRYATGGPVISSPALALDGTVYVGSDDSCLYAVNPDSTLKWFYKTDGCIQSSPAVAPNATIYVGSNDTYLYSIDQYGGLRWRFRPSGSGYAQDWRPLVSSPSIGPDGSVCVGCCYYCAWNGWHSVVVCANPSGSEVWEYQVGTYIQYVQSPSLGPDGTIYIGSLDYGLSAIDPAGGLKWRYATDGYIYSTAVGNVDGTVYVGSSDMFLYAIHAFGK
jgi:outer membrane protein assembly factor BamB